MPWLVVDRDGTEKIMSTRPVRRNKIASAFLGIIKCLPSPYRKSQRHKWASLWSTDPNDPLPEGAIELPKGTIKILTGKVLSCQYKRIEINKSLLLL